MIEMPVLDNKSYRRIFNEALATIPSLTDKWTDFNPQDTGIMLLELLAGMTEMQNFYLDQVGERFYRKLLAPLVDADENQAADELFKSLELEQTRLRRAVTSKDYHKILIEQRKDFELDGADVLIDGKAVRISVWRKSHRLSAQELEAIGACLEKYRLLTVRIYLEQAEAGTGSENTNE